MMRYLLLVSLSLFCSCFITPTTLVKRTKSPLKSSFFDDIVASTNEKSLEKGNEAYLAQLQKRVEKINSLENDIEDLGDEELTFLTNEFKTRLKAGEDINGAILEEAFAVVREAAWRVLEQRHYDVQLLGGMILHDGRLAEMATGEGKTLVSTLPCYLNALTGKGSFVVTVNDYLAKRDCEKMGQVHRFLGLSVGLIQSGMSEEDRKKAYGSDVVYVTNSELGFDYLRDHLALSKEGTVLPGGASEFAGFCVVDEADSVLIDEARTPLIISKQEPAPANKYKVAQQLANALMPNLHYDVDQKNKNIVLNGKGYSDSENALGIQSLFAVGADGSGGWAPYVSNAVKAKELFTKDIDYSITVDEKGEKVGIGIIDSFTGRVLDGRRWSDGLHQSIEAKEDIAVSQQSKVIAKVTYQSLFRQFSRLSGMTGTAISDALELETTYGLRVTPVPTALPIARRDYPDVVYKSRTAADKALVSEVVSVGGGDKGGRPCLIGTTSVSMSEKIAQILKKNGINAELLNANPLNAAREGEIIAQAGRPGVVTVATNMAGRGTDILLGGCASTMARLKARDIVVQQGVLPDEDKPSSPAEEYYPCPINSDISSNLVKAAGLIKKDVSTEISLLQLDDILTIATDTTEAEDEPAHITLLRDSILQIRETYDEILIPEKETVQDQGGLYVMGTNRHESSRIDNQLRGRAGRQGDPGTSRFFLSFQDDMLVTFGGDGFEKILNAFRVSDDMPVEAPQVTKALDKVQAQVEEKYREIRTQILEFDEILNAQRRVIYKERQETLFATPDETVKILRDYHQTTIQNIVEAQFTDADVDVDKIVEKIIQFFPSLAGVVTSSDIKNLDQEGTIGYLGGKVNELLDAKIEETEEKGKASGNPAGALARSMKYITLVSIDNAWSDHLQNMENLKETVILRKYQNLDPVAEYRKDSFDIFQGLENNMKFNTVFSLWQSLVAKPDAQAA